jgi:hypothetical protein
LDYWIIEAWENYCFCEEFKVLPFSGGLMEQPAKAIDIMIIIKNCLNEFKAQQNEILARDIRAKEVLKSG